MLQPHITKSEAAEDEAVTAPLLRPLSFARFAVGYHAGGGRAFLPSLNLKEAP